MDRKQRRRLRKKRLDALIKLVDQGKVRSSREYISPDDRSSYNYGYMEIDEMLAGTPNV